MITWIRLLHADLFFFFSSFHLYFLFKITILLVDDVYSLSPLFICIEGLKKKLRNFNILLEFILFIGLETVA